MEGMRVIMSIKVRFSCAMILVATVLGVDLLLHAPAREPAGALWSATTLVGKSNHFQLMAQGRIPMPRGALVAHASNLLTMPAGHSAGVTAFWFAGDRESAPNVQIAASQFDRGTQQWSAARYVVNRHKMGAQLGFGLRRLGNPVSWLDGSGRIHLFVVATGLGGWAAARILHLVQSSVGSSLSELEFEPVRVMPLSWFWNTSFLVRNAPLLLADGGMVLPVHFELGIKYPVALRFDNAGEFSGMVRMSQRHYLLQPTILMQTPAEWIALMRDDRPDGKVTVAQTKDNGRHWSDLEDLALTNPDAALAGMALAPNHVVLAHNASEHSRAFLDLSISADGLHWASEKVLSHGSDSDEYSYPAMAWADGSLWVSYTDHRRNIAWQRFASDTTKHGDKP